ncbi:ATPase [Xylariaceae sp. FL1272]|nr:ATPase [Xylariaceae sp. FL1272]
MAQAASNEAQRGPASEPSPQEHDDATNEAWFAHSSARRTNTDVVIAKALSRQYPNLQLVIAPPLSGLSLLNYAQAGHASCTPIEGKLGHAGGFSPVTWTVYTPPRSRLDGSSGALGEKVNFGKFAYKWQGHDFILYIADGRDGNYPYGATNNHYLLSTERHHADALLLAAGSWGNELHDEVWVFDQGRWQKNADLYHSIIGASWDNVILDPDMKKSIIDDHLSFFKSRDTYTRLKVPWKRGIIYHGPPGNGKTISIKATMRMLSLLKDPVPTLYVRTLSSFAPPEFSLKLIFEKARQFAPCYLVFEDLDSIVTDRVRSYFLNEVDGLKSNDGIFMIGSTNHLDRLDPGIAKRPSRFDRKYFFPDPDLEQRVAYCEFWQGKLADNDEVEFPDELCRAIAEITDKFSFAYMQEAFVAALLAIARRSGDAERQREKSLTRDVGDGWLDVHSVAGQNDDGLDDNTLWVEIKKQIAILREGLEDGESAAKDGRNWL